MPLILAADTSTAINSVALCDGDTLLAEAVIDARRLHSERLLPTVQWLLNESGMSLRDLDLLAISIGPGSFTGLRIGAATWKGLAFANELPLIGVPTLDAMARLFPAPPRSYAGVALDARMKEVFYAVYRFSDGRPEKVIPDAVGPVSALVEAAESLPDFDAGGLALLGDGVQLYREKLQARWGSASFAAPVQSVPRASAVALEAAALHASGANADPGLVNPVYLRKSQAEVNRDKRLASATA